VTRAREDAELAWSYVPEKSESNKAYGMQALRFPSLLHSAGLCQTLAFLASKHAPGTPGRRFLDDVARVVLRDPQTSVASLEERARCATLQEYMHLTRRTFEVSAWFKRYAQSKLEVRTTDEPRDATGAAS
jgi:CRISPR-associated protein Cmr5